MITLLQELHDHKDVLLDIASIATFKNNNASKKESKVVSIHEAMDPMVARNNCWTISASFLKTVQSIPNDLNVAYDRLQVTGIETPAGSHYGLLASKGDAGVIVDFSARQFDPLAPFPMIMDMWEWQEWSEQHIGRMGSWFHDNSWDY